MIYNSREIIEDLKVRYPKKLNPELTSVRIVQSKEECLIVSVTNEAIAIDNLDVIADDDLIYLSSFIKPSIMKPSLTLDENVRIFLEEIDEETILNVFDNILI